MTEIQFSQKQVKDIEKYVQEKELIESFNFIDESLILSLRVDKQNSEEIISCISKISSVMIDNTNRQFGARMNHENKDRYKIEITTDKCKFDDYILFYGSYVGLSEKVILSIWEAVDERDKGGIKNALGHIYNNLMLPKYDTNISDLSEVTGIPRNEIIDEFVNIKDEYKI